MQIKGLTAFIGISLPLIAIAGSAVAYVIKIYRESATIRREQFFELMKLLDDKGTIAAKVAAVYHLRQFPEHKDFIVRFCEIQKDNILGDRGLYLTAEMQLTLEHFSKR
ncbi:hypothetical protein DD563_14215 [Pelagicola sp. LXJ1103]|nr:hypothetical protein DD563_14215 [Pelagicola sp. LXJ1103]